MNKAITPAALSALRHKLLDNVVDYALDEIGANAILALGVFSNTDGSVALFSTLTGTAPVDGLVAYLRELADDLERDHAEGAFRQIRSRPPRQGEPDG